MNKEGQKRRSLAIAGRYIRYYMDGDLFAFNWIDSIGGTEFHENLNTAVSIGNWSVVLCYAMSVRTLRNVARNCKRIEYLSLQIIFFEK